MYSVCISCCVWLQGHVKAELKLSWLLNSDNSDGQSSLFHRTSFVHISRGYCEINALWTVSVLYWNCVTRQSAVIVLRWLTKGMQSQCVTSLLCKLSLLLPGAVLVLCSWKGNSRSGVTLAVHHRFSGMKMALQPFYRAMLCTCGTSHGPVSVSVCLSQVGVLLKRLNVGSHKQHRTIAQGL